MKKIPFNVNAYAARLIGRENISNLEGAIIELVKNSYDADANYCILYFEESTQIVYIIDNGIGMTEETIKNHWMTIGNSSKDKKYISNLGRVQTGAKGIGRFALDRISDKCEMYTNHNENKIIWKVDWSTFSRKENITDIYAEIENTDISISEYCSDIKNDELKKFISENINVGTVFKLTTLRDNEWNSDKVKDIDDKLSKLIPPNVDNNFSIYFYEENTDTESALITPENIETYDYKIEFNVYDNGDTHIEINRNEFDFKDEFEEVIKRAGFKNEDKDYFKGKNIVKDVQLKDLINLSGEDEANPIGKFNGTLYFYI